MMAWLKASGLNRLIALSGALSALLLVWMNAVDMRNFQAALPHYAIPDFMAGGYDSAYLASLRLALGGAPDAAQTLRTMHMTADLILPVTLSVCLALVMLRFLSGSTLFGRVLRPAHVRALLVLPAVYAIVDYAENAASLLYFPPSEPSDLQIRWIETLLPWLTASKYMALAIIAVLLLRHMLLIRLSGKDTQS